MRSVVFAGAPLSGGLCVSGVFGLEASEAKSEVGQQALELFHWLALIFCDIEITVVSGLVHGH
jgi:hypothetical protein